MTQDEFGMLMFGVIAGLAVFAAGFLIGCISANDECSIHEDAVENGVGEYYLDKDNERQFRWKKGNQ